MDFNQIKEHLDSFLVMLELSDVKVKYQIDYNSLYLINTDQQPERDILFIYKFTNRCVIQLNDYSNRLYSEVFNKTKLFLVRNNGIEFHSDISKQRKKLQFVVNDLAVMQKFIEVIIDDLMAIIIKQNDVV